MDDFWIMDLNDRRRLGTAFDLNSSDKVEKIFQRLIASRCSHAVTTPGDFRNHVLIRGHSTVIPLDHADDACSWLMQQADGVFTFSSDAGCVQLHSLSASDTVYVKTAFGVV